MNFEIRDRLFLQEQENRSLSPLAAKSENYHCTRRYPEPEHPYRTAFQRDRDRIIHSRAFRRLKHKRQVFLTQSGDHYRTRLTHTLEVAQLSRTLARSLGLNEDLTEAIALGHDLGHTPFGHVGEIILHKIMSGRDDLDGVLPAGRDADGNAGGYKHNYQSLRVVDVIEKKYSWEGLNLTAAVREGLLKHTRLRRNDLDYPDFYLQGLHYEQDSATTLEGQLVAVSDEIAQRTHDLEDGIRAQYVTLRQVRKLEIMKRVEAASPPGQPVLAHDFLQRNHSIRSLINFLVTDVQRETQRRVIESGATGDGFHTLMAWFSDPVHPLQEELDHFIDRYVIRTTVERHSDDRAVDVLRTLFKAYYRTPQLLPAWRLQTLPLADDGNAASLPQKEWHIFLRAICDYIAGMSDHFAETEYTRIESVLHES